MKLVVFDVDGTLVDSQADILAAMAAAFASEEMTLPDRATVLGIVGLSLPLAIGRLVPDADAAQLARMVAVYKDSFASTRVKGGGPLYPGAFAALERLRAEDEVLLGLATGKSRRGMLHIVDSHGMTGWFQTMQCADDHPSKPHPSMLLTAMVETGVEAADTMFVGDTTFDVEMGRAAGVTALGVSWGYHPAEALHRAGAASVLDGFDALWPALLSRWGMQDG